MNIVEKKVLDNKAVSYKIHHEDYTVVEPLVYNLREDPRVSRVGYIKDHPLDKFIEIRLWVRKNKFATDQSIDVSADYIMKETIKNLIETLKNYKEDINKYIN